MTDDVRTALYDLAREVDTTPLDVSGLARAASGRRRRRRLGAVAGLAAVLVALPSAWAAVQPPERLVPDVAAPAGGGQLVGGRFEVRYDGQAYDEQRAGAALADCVQLPGLRYGSSLESLPPIDLLGFLGSAEQLAEAQRCLQGIPAARVTFIAEEGPPVELRLSARQDGKRLQVSVGDLRANVDDGLEHTLSVRNTTDATLYVDEVRLFADLAGGALRVRSQVCSQLADPGEPEFGAGDCRSRYSPIALDPGQTWTTLVSVWLSRAAAPELVPGEYTFSHGVSMRTTRPVTADDRDASDGVLFDLTYVVHDVLSDAAPAAEAQPPEGQTQTVQVFFSSTAEDGPGDYCNQVVAVPRELPVTAAVATAALNELFGGPTSEEERSLGAGSLFSAATADLLRSVRIEDGTAYVDLRDFRTHPARNTLGAASTSCGGTAFLTSVTRTLTQFPTVQEVHLAFDGDPRAFVEWMQGFCPEPVPAGDPCDPEPFR